MNEKKDKEKSVLCVRCEEPIPQERLEALPDTNVCVKCSDVKPVYGDSRYGDLVVGKSDEDQRRMRLKYE